MRAHDEDGAGRGIEDPHARSSPIQRSVVEQRRRAVAEVEQQASAPGSRLPDAPFRLRPCGVPGSCLDEGRRRVVDRRDRPEAAGLVVGERLEDLLARVHDERAHPGDRLADRPAAEDQDVEVRAAALLDRRRVDRERVAGAEHRELAGLRSGAASRPDRPVPDRGRRRGRCSRRATGSAQPGAGAERRVDERHRRVGRARARCARRRRPR